ncbi:hypothetical protein TRAPUB_11372 [Trametes pubescens]|uniref:Uncharacterized protein n=1 Tax=Trametes pubescens TaxID=154538 RepID=A0A1M2VX29_TRAPU|nr:hypothetical protein TRAPUB_11372 [Trametes pubescens]
MSYFIISTGIVDNTSRGYHKPMMSPRWASISSSTCPLAKLDESRLQESKGEAYRQIHKMMADIPIPKQDVRVGPPIDLASTRGYTISEMTFK